MTKITGFNRRCRSGGEEHSTRGDRKGCCYYEMAVLVAVGGTAAGDDPHTPTDQRGNVDEGKITTEPSRSGKITGFPNRIEFSLEGA